MSMAYDDDDDSAAAAAEMQAMTDEENDLMAKQANGVPLTDAEQARLEQLQDRFDAEDQTLRGGFGANHRSAGVGTTDGDSPDAGGIPESGETDGAGIDAGASITDE